MKRSGFSLVELVLSIVIIAIALMTVPLMLSQTSKSNQYALVQESILAARTKMSNILSFKWDENSADVNGSVVRVLDVANGADDLNRTTFFRRKGHVREDLRRRMMDIDTQASAIGLEGATINDIDDFDGNISQVVASGGTGVKGNFDYLDSDLNLSIAVSYIFDVSADTNYSEQTISFDFNVSNESLTTTNIKMIEINATSKNRDFPFVFRAFSSNIGQSKLYERVK